MPDIAPINPQAVSGTSRERASQFTFNNPRQGIPNVTIQQEMLTELTTGSVFAQSMPSLNADFDNPAFPISLYDPVTGDATGQTILAEELHAILYSLWRHLRA